MRVHVLDANALVRLYRNLPGADAVQKLFEHAKSGQTRLFISAVNLAEVHYILSKYFRPDQALQFITIAGSAVETVSVDRQIALEAAALKTRHKLGLADCFAAELAMRLGATLVTADPEFAKLGKKLKVLALRRHGA